MNPKSKIYTIIASLLLLSMTVILFLIYPSLKSIKTGGEKIMETRGKIISLAEQKSNLEKFKINYQQYLPELETLENTFADKEQPVGFIEFLENTALLSGVSDFNISIFSDAQSKEAKPAGFTVSVKGEFWQVLNFSRKLETGPYLVSIEKINLNQGSVKTEKDLSEKLNANFFINVQ